MRPGDDVAVLVVGGAFGGLALGVAFLRTEVLPSHALGTPLLLVAFVALGGVLGLLAGRRP